MNDEIKVPTMQVTPLKKICMTIGELPTSYLETMSYYEMLVWFTNYLRDNIIPVVNNNGEATHELQVLFTELQSYVNNYFDNLDVQDEINNKLDEMAESGQLTDIIAQYLGLAGMIAFDNVSSMKLAENLVNGSKCHTLGYYTAGDGGSSLYKVRTITNEDVVDEKTIIALYDNTLVAEIICVNSINPEQVGAKGDNETDDTTAIQTAINYANTKSIKLNFMKKTYKITDSLNIYSGMEINGNNATIKLNANKPIITSQSVINNINIHDINLRGSNNDEYTSNDGLYLTCYYSNFDNIRINDCEHGIYLDTTGATGTLVENRFNELTIYNCNYSFYGGTNSNNKITDGFVTNSIFNNKSNSHPAIYIGSSAGWTIDNIHIYGSCSSGISIDNTFYTNISNIYVEEAKNALISSSIQNNLNISNINGVLKYPNCAGIRLDRASFHYPVSGANISNVYLVAETNATNSVGINIVNTALQLNVSNYTQSVSADNSTFKDFNTYTNINVHYVKNKLTDLNSAGILKFKRSFVGLSFKLVFDGTNEKTISIPLDNAIYSYSMSKISINMISKQYWDGDVSINYSTDIILVDKNGTKSVSKLNETGTSSGFTNAPTYAYNSTTNTLDVTFTPSSNRNGFLFATII